MIQLPPSSKVQPQRLPSRSTALSVRPLRWLIWTQLLVLPLAAYLWGITLTQERNVVSFAFKTDFLGVYIGTHIMATGRGPQLYDLRLQHRVMETVISPYHRDILMPFVYPAYVAVLLRPLGSLSLESAYLVWLWINLAAAVWTAIRIAAWFASSLPERLAVYLTFFAWVPLQLSLWHGQLGILPALGVVQAWFALRSGHEWRAGWWLSLGLLKPQLILFPLLAFTFWRCWRTVLAFSIPVAATLAISVFSSGFWIGNYLRFLTEYNRRGAELSLYPSAMQNWRGLVSSFFTTDHGPAVFICLLLLTLASIVAVFRICNPPRSSRSSVSFLPELQGEARYATAVLLGLLSSPHLYMHDWVVALPMGIILWCFARAADRSGSTKSWSVPVLIWLLALAPMVFFVAQFGGWLRIRTIPIYMATLVAMAVMTLGTPEGSPRPLPSNATLHV
jgi:hypothetical protein